jgi:putative ABC transport system substrate-binding protein
MKMTYLSDAVVGACAGLIALSLFLTSDSSAPAASKLVAYVGAGPDPQGDFRYFLELAHEGSITYPASTRFQLISIPDQTRAALDDAVRRAVAAHAAVIVAPTSRSAQAAVRGAPGTPVVFASADDPISAGIIDSMQRRRTPITGVFFGDRLDGKRLELLHDAYPGVHRIGVIGDQDWVASEGGDARVVAEGARLGLETVPVLVENETALRARLSAPDAGRFDAWYVPRTNIGSTSYRIVIEAMRQLHRPCIYSTTTRVDDGGLMAYAQDETFMWAAMSELAARILDGENAGSIPVMVPHTFTLALRTNADTGVAAPDIRVVRRADVVLR